MTRLLCRYATILSLALLTGCSAYVGGYQYVPHPALAEIPPAGPDKTPPVSAFASVIGVFRGDAKQGLPESVEDRFRMENNGPHTISFDPRSLELTTGDLQSFPPPILRPPLAATLAPSQITMFDVFFPFPPGRSYDTTDLRSLQLRWSEKIDAAPVWQVVSFRRIYPYRYYESADPYWGYPWFVGGGVVVVHGGFHGGGHHH